MTFFLLFPCRLSFFCLLPFSYAYEVGMARLGQGELLRACGLFEADSEQERTMHNTAAVRWE